MNALRILPLLLVGFLLNPGHAEEPALGKGEKKLPMPGEAFTLDGRDAFVILPDDPKPETPWVWYAPTLPGLPAQSEVWMFEKFLAAGIAVAGIDVGESYGSPTGVAAYSTLYEYLTTKRGFGPKPCLLARSRGGLMLYSWAADNPEKVGGVAGIYPVCNIASYPGLDRACGAFGMTAAELKANLKKFNPIDRLERLAKAKVPILHLQGDSDKVVPLEANSKILATRYLEFSGPAEVVVIEGQGHNMWDGWFQSQRLTDFAIARALGKPADGIFIFGQVARQGYYFPPEEKPLTLSEAILAAGGFSRFANTKKIKVHRIVPGQEEREVIEIDTTSIRPKPHEQNPELKPGDVIVVPEKIIKL